MPDQTRTPPTILEIYGLQQRFDRLRRLRRVARTLTVVALGVLAASTIILDRSTPSTPLFGALIGIGLAVWLLTFALDYRVHSQRLDSRMIMMRLRMAQSDIDEIEQREPPDSSRLRRRTLAS